MRLTAPIDLRAIGLGLAGELARLCRPGGTAEQALRDRPEGLAVVALENGVVGWSCVRRRSQRAPGGDGWLDVFVREDMRRKGLGKTLGRAGHEAAKARWPGERFWAEGVDEAGHALYRSLGFTRPNGKRRAG